MRNRGFVFGMVVLVMVMVMCMGQTVMGQSKKKLQVNDEYYRQIEKTYVGQVKSKLIARGYDHPGVTMTVVLNEEGNREYTLHIHHARIDKMDDTKRADLSDMLLAQNIGVKEANVSIDYVAYAD